MSEREKLKDLARRGDQKALEEIFSELEQAERERDDLMGVTGAQKFGQGWTLPFFNTDGSETRMTPQQWVDKRKESAAALRTLREASGSAVNLMRTLQGQFSKDSMLRLTIVASADKLSAALAAEGGK